MTNQLGKVCVMRMLCGALFGWFSAGCETSFDSPSTTTTTSSASPALVEQVTSNTTSVLLNDDPNCELVIKYQNRDVENVGQVQYVNRILTSSPFKSANPICVQYNDTRTGEVTVWKDTSSRGQRIDILPRDRGIDKIVVWYQ